MHSPFVIDVTERTSTGNMARHSMTDRADRAAADFEPSKSWLLAGCCSASSHVEQHPEHLLPLSQPCFLSIYCEIKATL